jgi:hypothetical protein
MTTFTAAHGGNSPEGASQATMPGPGPGRLTALHASWLFDGTSSALIPDPVVLIDGNAIREVSSGGSAPQDATVIDLPGATLLPVRHRLPPSWSGPRGPGRFQGRGRSCRPGKTNS